MATWNIRQFGAGSGNPGPQIRRVRDVISGVDADLWGVQEISDTSDFAQVRAGLPSGYATLLANDPLHRRWRKVLPGRRDQGGHRLQDLPH